ncbi:hypothetical protein [Kribbella sp. C-35]|uniref:hypothetical protein n=1 Tax=Kribbella sp. C-35 TaxID=2789276 RepID=UPI00397B4135
MGDTLKLALKKEDNRGRVITVLLGIFGLAIAGTVVASFRLPADQGVKQLNDLSNTLLVVVVGAIAYYFGARRPSAPPREEARPLRQASDEGAFRCPGAAVSGSRWC